MGKQRIADSIATDGLSIMLRWLKNLFGPSASNKHIESCSRAVLVFMRSVKNHVDQRDFMIPNHHTFFYCYAYGAITVEAAKYNLNETERFAALLLLFPNLSDMSPDEISALMNRCVNFLDDKEGQQYQQDGAEHYTRWCNADAGVTDILGKLFALREQELSKANRAIIYP